MKNVNFQMKGPPDASKKDENRLPWGHISMTFQNRTERRPCILYLERWVKGLKKQNEMARPIPPDAKREGLENSGENDLST